MKRDMNLVRSILMKVADSDRPVTIEELADEEHDRQLVGYQGAVTKVPSHEKPKPRIRGFGFSFLQGFDRGKRGDEKRADFAGIIV